MYHHVKKLMCIALQDMRIGRVPRVVLRHTARTTTATN